MGGSYSSMKTCEIGHTFVIFSGFLIVYYVSNSIHIKVFESEDDMKKL